MNKLKEFAEKLNGRQYRDELTKELETYAKQNEIVIVFGASDDLIEIRGAIDEEFACWEVGTYYLGYAKVEAVWCPIGKDYCWGYNTDFPHETFMIYEDDEPYCEGIVFYLKEIKTKRTNYDKITESVESLANMLVQMSLFGDFVPFYYAPDGTEFFMDKEGAIQYTIEWLRKECEDEKEN